MLTFKRYWFGFWVRLAYLFNLRKLVCYFWRWWFKEQKMAELPKFNTPEEAQQYLMSKFQYRYDQIRLQLLGRSYVFPIDWVSDPRVFQAKLENQTVKDGDCDDAHMWAAAVLSMIPGVEKVRLLSSGFIGGGHATAVFMQNGKWRHFDYELYELADVNDAPTEVAKRYAHSTNKEVPFWVFEEVKWPNVWKPVAICPKKL